MRLYFPPSLTTPAHQPVPRPEEAVSDKGPSAGTKLEITISWTALFKIIAVVALVGLAITLGRLLGLIFLALLLSLALSKIVQVCIRWRWPRWIGVAIAAMAVFVFVAAAVGLALPAVANQGSALITRLPEVQKEIVEHLPASGPIRDAANKLLKSASFSDPQPLLDKFMAWGGAALQSFSEFLVILVIAIYFLIDGNRIFEWLIAFLPKHHRNKVRAAGPQIVEIVSLYVGGQFITSALCGAYAFIVLYFLHVPNAAVLAVLAAVVDILPVIGFFVFVIPAVAVAFTVSPVTAALAALLYGAYHLLEAYFIVPKVYGNQLKLSTLTVLIACMAGWLLAGVIGAIAILPVIASYPIIEKLWLSPHLEPDTVPKHLAIEKRAHPDAA